MRSGSAITTSSETSSRRLAGREAALLEQPVDLGRQAEVEQVGRPEVDGHREVEPIAAALADLLQRAVEHERGQRAPEPAVIGERQEVGRHQQPAPRVRPAHQRLDAAHRRRSRSRPSAGSAGRAGRRRARRAARRAARAGAARGGRARAGRPRGRCACAWPRTSRRRRAAAARARPRRARGRARSRSRRRCARGSRRRANERSSAARRRRPAALADASSPGSSTTANSSPPSRASVSPGRSASPSRGPIWLRTSSPAWWPSVSLSSLKPSRSISSSATSPRASTRSRPRGARADGGGCRARSGRR